MRSDGKTGISLLVVGIAVLIGLAVVKPWASAGPDLAPPLATAAASPSAVRASQAPTPAPPVVGTPVPVDSLDKLDWSAIGAALQPHDQWGIRMEVYRPADHTIGEQWTAVKSSDADVQAAVNNADAYAVLGWDGTLAALGLTTPFNQLPLDVRMWRDLGTSQDRTIGWRQIPVIGLTPSGDPSTRLLRLPPEWSKGRGWSHGEYQLDVLLETGVWHIHLWLDGDAGAIPAAPLARTPPKYSGLLSLGNSPGGFILSGGSDADYLFSGLPASTGMNDEFRSWLALGSSHVFWAPGLYDPPPTVVGTANSIGVALAQGQTFDSAHLVEVAPVSADLGVAEIWTTQAGVAGSVAASLAVFHPANAAAGFANAQYRVDGAVRTSKGLVNMSWDIPLMERPTSTESLVLAADRAWPHLPKNGWTVLAPGRRALVSPSASENLPADPGTACRNTADAGAAPWYFGVVHPGGAFNTVTVRRLDGATRGTVVPTQLSQLVDGLVAITPIPVTWPSGRYGIWMQAGPDVQRVSVCVE